MSCTLTCIDHSVGELIVNGYITILALALPFGVFGFSRTRVENLFGTNSRDAGSF